MTIIYSSRFEDEFLKIYKFISIDSLNRANKFKTQFLINNQKEKIIILGIFNQNQWDLT